MICQSYCSHGGRCCLSPGHRGLHDTGFCTWTDAQALTRDEADRVLAQTPEGQEFLNAEQPLADLLEMLGQLGEE